MRVMGDPVGDLGPHLWLLVVGATITLAITAAAVRVDLRARRLPNRTVGAAAAASWVTGAVLVATDAPDASLVRMLVSVAVIAGPLLVVWAVVPAGVGAGDVKLAGALAPLVAWPATLTPLLALALMFVLAVPQALHTRTIAFGPYIVAGITLTMVLNVALL